jgi:hypothetical protein
MDKKQQSPEEIYKANQTKSKVFKRVAPFVFWGCLALAIVFLFLALKNSFGNIAEICQLLDTKEFTGEQLRNNYTYLTNKFGEWVIGNGGAGFTITFINIGRAVFSGVMIVSCFLSGLFLICAYLLGKWLLPRISEQILQENQDMVNLTILKDHDKLEEK